MRLLFWLQFTRFFYIT